jgi:broad specificity phosphatase PhoE
MDEYRARFGWWRYLVLAAGTLIVASWLYWYICWGSATTVLLVRHGDRLGSQDALSPTGLARAQELVHVMERSGIRATYHSEATRTQQTAAPVAAALGITPIVVAAADVAALADDIRANHVGAKVLVVGHSDTVPQIIAALGGPVVSIPANEFDNLYVLTLCPCNRRGTTLTNLQYGPISP